jgi:hypothetical protein
MWQASWHLNYKDLIKALVFDLSTAAKVDKRVEGDPWNS